MLILGIETSCDETAAAIVEDGRHVLSGVVSSQDEIHSAYGGVVPELASRAHMQAIVPVMDRALEQAGVTFKDLHGLAVTQGPGLVGSLLVGICTAKSIAAVTRLPIAGVNHLEAHVIVNFLSDDPPSFPFTALVVSGGHTNLYLVKDFLEFELLGRPGTTQRARPSIKRPNSSVWATRAVSSSIIWPGRATRTPSPSPEP